MQSLVLEDCSPWPFSGLSWSLSSINHHLDQRLDALSLSSAEREAIDRQRPQLAAAQTDDRRIRGAIAESFMAGYRTVTWICVVLTLASSLSAALLIGRDKA